MTDARKPRCPHLKQGRNRTGPPCSVDRRYARQLARRPPTCPAYISPLWFFTFLLSFYRRLISEVIERISTELGHIINYDSYLKNLIRTPQGITPTDHGPQAVGKNAFGTDFELWSNISLQRNMISTIRNRFVNLQGLLYMRPNLVNFCPETAENGAWSTQSNAAARSSSAISVTWPASAAVSASDTTRSMAVSVECRFL